MIKWWITAVDYTDIFTQLNRLLGRIVRSCRTSALVPWCEWTKPAGGGRESERDQQYRKTSVDTFLLQGLVRRVSSKIVRRSRGGVLRLGLGP